MNYKVISNEGRNQYKIQFNDTEDKYATWSRSETPSQQFFLQLLLADLLTQISIRIEKYSYHTTGKSNIVTASKTVRKEANEHMKILNKHKNFV